MRISGVHMVNTNAWARLARRTSGWLAAVAGVAAVAAALQPGASTAATTTLTVKAVADASVRSGTPTSNYGSTTTIRADGSPVENVLLRFVVSGTAGQQLTG